MTPADDVPSWLTRWRGGDAAAPDEVFARFARPLAAAVGRRLGGTLAARLDPEDVVQSAFRSFFAAAHAGRVEVRRGDDLWGLLATIAFNKLRNQARRHTEPMRDVGREQPLGVVAAAEPDPAEVVAVADELDRLFAALPADHRPILELRLQGHGTEEIAAATGRSERTVRRVLAEVKDRLEAGR